MMIVGGQYEVKKKWCSDKNIERNLFKQGWFIHCPCPCFLLYRWAQLQTTCPLSLFTSTALARIKLLDLSISISCCPVSAGTPTKSTVSSKFSAAGQPRDLRCVRVEMLCSASLSVNVKLKWQSSEWFEKSLLYNIIKHALYFLFLRCRFFDSLSYILKSIELDQYKDKIH